MFDAQKLISEMTAVWRFAVHLCAAQDAETLIQEVYLRAFDAGSRQVEAPMQDARLWLFRITCDVLHARPPAAHKPPGAHSSVPPPKPDDPIDHRLQSAICSLPMPERMVFLLSVAEQLRYEDIAAVLRTPVDTVATRLGEAHRHLRQLPEFASLAPATTPDTDKTS